MYNLVIVGKTSQHFYFIILISNTFYNATTQVVACMLSKFLELDVWINAGGYGEPQVVLDGFNSKFH